MTRLHGRRDHVHDPRRRSSTTATRCATAWRRSSRSRRSCSPGGRTPRSSSGSPGRPGSTRGPTAFPPRRSKRRSGATRSCTSSNTATSGTTRRTARTSASSASALPSSTCSATRTTRSSATTTTGPRCACPAPPASATWARSASASSTGTRTTARARSSRRSTSARRPATSAAATSARELGLDGRAGARRHEPRRARLPPGLEADAPGLGSPGHDGRAGPGGDRLRAAPPRGRRPGDGAADRGAGTPAPRGDRSRRNVQARGRGEELMEFEFGAPGTIMPPADKAVEFARKAEADGYETIWWPSHLMGWHPESVWTEDITPLAKFQPNPHTYFDPLVMMGVAGAVTEKIRVGVVVTDILTHHPAVLAQTALTLDHVTQGRAILGLGSGEQLNVEPYGMEWDKPVGHLDEALDLIRLLWNAGRTCRLRRPVLHAQGRSSRPVAVHAGRPADLDRRAQAADARHHRQARRRLATHEDASRGVRCRADEDPRGVGGRGAAGGRRHAGHAGVRDRRARRGGRRARQAASARPPALHPDAVGRLREARHRPAARRARARASTTSCRPASGARRRCGSPRRSRRARSTTTRSAAPSTRSSRSSRPSTSRGSGIRSSGTSPPSETPRSRASRSRR